MPCWNRSQVNGAFATLGSYNGTFVDYEKITQRTMVIPGQVVQIGRTRFVLREGPPFL